MSPDDKYIAGSYDENHLAVWDVEQGTLIKEWQEPVDINTPNRGSYLDLEWSPDGTLLAGSSNSGIVDIWESSNFSNVQRLYPFQDTGVNKAAIVAIRWSPDRSRVYLGAGNGVILVWELDSNQLIETITIE